MIISSIPCNLWNEAAIALEIAKMADNKYKRAIKNPNIRKLFISLHVVEVLGEMTKKVASNTFN